MRSVIFATAFVLACTHLAQGATPPPAEAYGRLPAIGSAALSPDGKRVVVSVGYEYRATEPDRELTSLSVIDLDAGKVERDARAAAEEQRCAASAGRTRSGLTTTSAARGMRATWPPAWPVMVAGPASRVVPHRRAVAGDREIDTADAGRRQPRQLLADQTAGAHRRRSRIRAHGRLGRPRHDEQHAETLGISRQSRQRESASAVETANVKRAASCSMSRRHDRPRRHRRRQEPLAALQLRERQGPHDPRTGIRDGPAAVSTVSWKTGASPPSIRTRKANATRCSRSIARPARRRPWKACRTRDGSDVAPIGDPWRHRVVGARWTEDLPKQHFFDAELAKIAAAVQPLFDERIRDAAILVARPQARLAVRRALQRCRRVLRLRHRDQEAAHSRQAYPQLTSPEHLGDRQSIKYRGARRQADSRLSHAAGGRRAEAICRSCCWCTAVRTRATISRSTGGRASWPRAATPCCSPTTAARPVMDTSGSMPAARAGATA